MKQHHITTHEYILMEKSFTEWLENMNYSESAIKNYPKQLREFFHFLEGKSITTVTHVNQEHINAFAEQIKNRKNIISGAGLSSSHINQILQSVKLLFNYLQIAKGLIIEAEVKLMKEEVSTKDILSVEEVKQLLDSIDSSIDPHAKKDKAVIAILYGAGLRKAELEQLNTDDISFKEKTLLVRNGKGNKQRLIPLTETTLEYIQDYITGCRDHLADIAAYNNEALFINIHGQRLKEDTYYNLLKERLMQCGIDSLQQKHITLHSFRHSIATHLMIAGMQIEDIALFLGHSSLDSTMIYTHLAEELKSSG